jgi:hypothetical protein
MDELGLGVSRLVSILNTGPSRGVRGRGAVEEDNFSA